MQIYICSSWKNQHAVEMLTEMLEQRGHTVISFVRKAAIDEGRAHFGSFSMESWINSNVGIEKFDFDTRGATTSDLVIYIGPSGMDAGCEIGAAWHAGVPIYGLWAKGEQIGLMRHMINLWFKDYKELLQALVTYRR
jgi:hypothetical protein